MEAHAISTFRAWNDDQIAEVKRREDILTAELKALIPQSLKAWVKEDMGNVVIDALIKDGKRSEVYGANEYNRATFDFIILKKFAERFKELKTAWKGIVNISINQKDSRLLEVTFTAI